MQTPVSIESDGQQTLSIKPLGPDHTPDMENVCWIVGTLLYGTVVAIWVHGLVHATRARRRVWFVLVLVGVMPSAVPCRSPSADGFNSIPPPPSTGSQLPPRQSF